MRITRTSLTHLGCGLALSSLAVLQALADDRPSPPPPPPEAYTACQGKAEGDQTTVTLRSGETVTATCRKIGDALAALPAGGPGGKRPPPPPGQ